jgi:uracil-DNA glycosylase
MLVPAVGKRGILLAGEFPGAEEIIKGVPFVGKAGEVLRTELAIAGMSIEECRLTNLWLHSKSDCDLDWHISRLVEELMDSHHALLMGSDITKALFDSGVMALSTLEMKTKLFPNTRVFVSPNPAQLFYSPVGEFRLALRKFVEAVREDE